MPDRPQPPVPTALCVAVVRSRPDVAALFHVVDLLTAYLAPPQKWTVEDAAERGLVHLLTFYAARQAACDPVCPYLIFDFDKVITKAARCGHVQAMRWLLTYRPDDLIPSTAMDAAAEGGHLKIVQWLHAHPGFEGYSRGIINRAAANGHLDVVKWLHSHSRKASCSKYAMDRAAANGHLDVVQWLHENRKEGCSFVAMQEAAANGHLEVVQFLRAHRTEGNPIRTLKSAAARGHLHVMEWLYEAHLAATSSSRDVSWLDDRDSDVSAIDEAAGGGHLHVVQWLVSQGATYCTTRAMDSAALFGHLETVQWLHANRSEGCTDRAMTGAAARGHLDVVRWLHENRSEGCSFDVLDNAAGNGHLDVVEFLHDHRLGVATSRALNRAVKNGHLHIVRWFHTNWPDDFTLLDGGLRSASSRGRLEMLRWLGNHRRESIESCQLALSDAVRAGHADAVAYLLTLFAQPPRTWVRQLMPEAIQGGHLEIVKLFHPVVPHDPTNPSEVERAACYGQLEMLQWLYTNRCPAVNCSKHVILSVAGSGYLAVLRWLIEDKGHECTADAINGATRGGHLEVIHYLCGNHLAVPTELTMLHAICHNRLRVVKWLVVTSPSLFNTERALEDAIEIAHNKHCTVIEAWLREQLAQLTKDDSFGYGWRRFLRFVGGE